MKLSTKVMVAGSMFEHGPGESSCQLCTVCGQDARSGPEMRLSSSCGPVLQQHEPLFDRHLYGDHAEPTAARCARRTGPAGASLFCRRAAAAQLKDDRCAATSRRLSLADPTNNEPLFRRMIRTSRDLRCRARFVGLGMPNRGFDSSE